MGYEIPTNHHRSAPPSDLQAKVDAANRRLSLAHVNTRAWEEWIRDRWEKDKPYGERPFERDFAIISLGLAGETGEVVELLKKFLRDGRGVRDDLVLELGDVLHYLTRIGQVFGIDLMEMMMENRRKLEQRDRDRRLAAARAALDKSDAPE